MSWAPKNFASGSERFGSSKENEAGTFSRPTVSPYVTERIDETQAVRLAKILKLANQQSARVAVIEFALGETTHDLPSSARVSSRPERQRNTRQASLMSCRFDLGMIISLRSVLISSKSESMQIINYIVDAVGLVLNRHMAASDSRGLSNVANGPRLDRGGAR